MMGTGQDVAAAPDGAHTGSGAERQLSPAVLVAAALLCATVAAAVGSLLAGPTAEGCTATVPPAVLADAAPAHC